MSRRLLSCGDRGVLVELDGLQEVLALHDVVRATVRAGNPAFADVVDVVPAARTLLVVVADGASLAAVHSALTTLAQTASTPPQPPPGPGLTDAGMPGGMSQGGGPDIVEILVHYDGPDLSDVCELTSLAPHEVVAAHTQTPWRVAFTGFSPGFAYLCGGDSRLQVPRRGEARTSVPAGAVALAGEFSAVYPRSSPGGWQLLGHTDAILWDIDRQPPALLQPGSTVCFVDAERHDRTNTAADPHVFGARQ